MKLNLFLSFLLVGLFSQTNAQYTTPNTGVNWTLDSIAANSPTTMTVSGNEYTLHEALMLEETDSLTISGSQTLKIATGIEVGVKGFFKSDGSDITITALDPESPFKGFWFYNSATVYFNNTLIEYGGGLKVVTPNFEMYNSEVSHQNGGSSTSAAISFSKGSPIIMFSIFENNRKAALSSAANASVSAWIEGNYFEANHLDNGNAPQINMGPSGPSDSTRVINNMVIGDRSLTKVGGISVSSLMGVENKILIQGNVVRDNRYGITSMGNSSGIISGNTIEDNNTEGDPMMGGSGINLFSTNEIMVTENQIRRNLWGITLQGTAFVNLGSDDSEDFNPGLNVFSENGNEGEIFALYNNTPNAVKALHNCWIENQESTYNQVEDVIYHVIDEASLGEVTFDPFECGEQEMSTSDLNEISFQIYPNPAKDFIVIDATQIGNVKIFDMNGKLIQKEFNIGNKSQIRIQLSKGIYLVEFETQATKRVQKLIVR